ncbi:hypothetical protein ACLK1S_20915 [Escherichia coli]
MVACTGYYQDGSFPGACGANPQRAGTGAGEPADEIEQGIDGTDLKAGIIAEIRL